MAKEKQAGNGAELMTLQQAYPALIGGGAVAAAINANLGGERMTVFDLERVRVPGSGGLAWEIPSEDGGEPSISRELDGIVVFNKVGRSYWSQQIGDGGGGSPPDCSSPDAVIGYGNPGGPCAECPLAQWASDPKAGRGQACKMQRFIFLLREGAQLPLVLAVPPSSLKLLKKYLINISKKGLPYYAVVTRFQLAKVKNAGGIEYAEVRPSVLRQLTPDEVGMVTAFAAGTKSIFEGYVDGAEEAEA